MKSKAKIGKHHGAGYDVWRALKSNKVAVACMLAVAIMVFVSVFADVLFDYETDVIAQDLVNSLQPPSAAHWFGTDALGRDYFSRVIYATRVTLEIGLISTVGSTLLSIIIGGLSAMIGGLFDTIVMRVMDILLAIPQTLMVICIIVAFGNSLINICVTMIICLIPGMARSVRADVMVNMENEYVEAARSVGASKMRILMTHLLPNCLGTILVRTTMTYSEVILSTAGLGYLGLGVKAPAPEWGRMLSEAQEYMRLKPYLIIIPGICILISAVVFNLLGDALQDAMDPRLRGFRKTKKKLFARRSAK